MDKIYLKIINIVVILYRLGNGLRTFKTLSQVTGYLNYKVSIYDCLYSASKCEPAGQLVNLGICEHARPNRNQLLTDLECVHLKKSRSIHCFLHKLLQQNSTTCMGWRIPSLDSALTFIWRWQQSHLSYFFYYPPSFFIRNLFQSKRLYIKGLKSPQNA